MRKSLNNYMKMIFIGGTFLTSSTAVIAAGFGVNEHSASGLGTAFAGKASNAQDASIGAENPAGITQFKHAEVSVGADVILKGGNLKGESNVPLPFNSSHDKNFLRTTVIPFGHFAMPINEKWSGGFNIYAPFGLNLKYDNRI